MAVEKYFVNSGQIVSDNANHNESFSNMQAHIVGETLKEYFLFKLPLYERQLYVDGALHIHNLEGGGFIPYCHGGSLLSLLTKGIKCGDVVSKPAKHFDVAIDHVVNYLTMVTQEFSGAVSFSDFNTLLSPFIKCDGLDYKTVKQSVQRLFFNLNFPSRLAFQSPFTNLTFNLKCPRYYSNMPAIVGGKPQSFSYGDCQQEADRILEATIDVLEEGDGDGRPLTFPIPTLNLVKGYEESIVWGKVLGNEVKMGAFYFTNYANGFLDENEVRAMCCRLQLNLKELSHARGLWTPSDGTGSLGVVSLNLGRLGYLVKKGLNIFDGVDSLLDSARTILRVKRRMVESSFAKGLLPLSQFYDLNLDHYFNTVGMVGLNEMYVNMDGFGTYAHLSDGAKLIDYINRRLKEFQVADGVLYNLEMTPAEGSCYSLALKDREKYSEIFTQGTIDEPYYSSLLIPSNEEIFWMYKLDAEAKLLPKFSGGTVHRIYLGWEDEPEVLNHVIGEIAKRTVPYFDFSPCIAYCPKCKIREVSTVAKCPRCGGGRELWSRIVGYIRAEHKANRGKRREISERKWVSLG